jgi:hypothetical protein
MNPLPHISNGDVALLIAFFLALLVLGLTVLTLSAVAFFRLFQRSRLRRRRADPHLRGLWAGTQTLYKTARPPR